MFDVRSFEVGFAFDVFVDMDWLVSGLNVHTLFFKIDLREDMQK